MLNGENAFSEKYPLLGKIASPDDLKAMPQSDMPELSAEIRSYLINQVAENGGHMASNLGTVELTLAIHRVFCTPRDHLIFDVGHQSYTHKLLTGRRERFATLRQSGGISGFPKRSESEHDCFGTGHSSTSLSAALGFAEADRLSGSDAYTVCVIGDGAYTGGMIHEALNNCRKRLRLIIILNENEMSISKNIGRFAKSLSGIRASGTYRWTKKSVIRVLSYIPFIGKRLVARLKGFKKDVKGAIYGSNLFENIGLRYLGPADGNNEAAVEKLLREAKACKESCVIHLKTKKGKGFAEAEAKPDKFHGMPPAAVSEQGKQESFSHRMGEELCKMAQRNPKICAITAAMAGGTGLEHFQGAFSTRFYDVGIAEEHAVTFAAGLAANGYRPAVAIYSTFLQRAYDNIIHDVALQQLPVVFFVDRAGMNASDGPTHYGVFDVAFLSQIPNIKIYSPITFDALRNAMMAAFATSDCACAIRYPNGRESADVVREFYQNRDDRSVAIRNDYLHSASASTEDPDAVIVTHGRIVLEAMKVKQILSQEGTQVGILLLEQISPYGEIAAQLAELLPQKACRILFLEEEIRAGGMGMMLSREMEDYDVMNNKTVSVMALENAFAAPCVGQTCLQAAGLDAESICRVIRGDQTNR